MRLADGLITNRISLGRRDVVVVKQPSVEQFYFFEVEEWEALVKYGNGDRGSIADDEDSAHEISSFLQSAAEQGLIVGHPASVQPVATSKPPWHANPLAIRIPGLDPSDFLTSIMHAIDRVGRSRLKLLAMATVMLAALVAILNLPALVADTTESAGRVWSSPNQGWLVFIIAVAIVKMGHEIAHGLACHWGGGRCREMGWLLLFGIPCLYCDVSDTWLMPKRRQRILVSAAGMMAEWLIASIALLVWSLTYQGFVHDLMSMLVIVASVSTIVINGNPLLRYDGYFILSDWIGVPNLGPESNQALRDWWTRAPPAPRQWGLVAYAIASGVYRILVIGLIVWFACEWLSKSLGVGVAIPVAFWVGWNVGRRWILVEVAAFSPRLSFSLAAVLFTLLLWAPLRQSTRVGGLVRPRGERPVYAPTSGVLKMHANSIEVVNWRQQLAMIAAEGDADEMETALRSREIERLSDFSISASLPLWRQRLQTANEKEAMVASRISEAVVSIPDGDQLYEPANKSAEAQRGDQRVQWEGVPTDHVKSNLVVDRGLLLGRLGETEARVVSAYVPDQQIDSIRMGASVTIAVGSYRQGSLQGKVIEVATDPVDELPPEIVASGWVRPDPRHRAQMKPETTHYEVTIEITSATRLPARLVTPVRISMPSESVWERLIRNWRSTSTLSI